MKERQAECLVSLDPNREARVPRVMHVEKCSCFVLKSPRKAGGMGMEQMAVYIGLTRHRNLCK